MSLMNNQKRRRSSSSNDHSRSRNLYRSRSSKDPEYLEAVKPTATAVSHGGDIPYQGETQQLQVSTGTKRSRVEGDHENDDRGSSTDNDEAYVVMEVTKEERREILERRIRQGNRDRLNHRNRVRPRQNHHHTDDQDHDSYYREDTERVSTKASLFRNAQHFNVTGGRTSVVGRNQTIVEKHIRRSPSMRSDFQEPKLSLALMEERSDSSNTANTEASAYANAKDFVIDGGEFSAVKGNLTITSTRIQEDKYPRSYNPISARRDFAPRGGRHSAKAWERNASNSSRVQSPYHSSPLEHAAPAVQPVQSLGSGASLLGFSSGFTLRDSKAYPGSFSAVGGNQVITIGAYSDSEGSDFHG